MAEDKKVTDYVGSGFKSMVEANRQLRKQTEALKEGTLGPTQAQKQQAMRGATDAAQQQAAAAVGDVAEMAFGGAGGMMGGQAAKALMGAAQGAAEAGTQAQVAINAQAAQMAEQRRQETMEALSKQRDEAIDTISKLTSGGGEALEGAVAGQQGSGGGADAAAGIAKMMIMMCWVAREVLPGQWRDCRTYILFGAPKWFRSFYIKNGPGISVWLCHNPWAKVPLRPLFRYFAWRGRKMGQENPALLEAQSHLL